MKLIIRADGDSKIGTGHIMRCIALAQGWQDRGGDVTFISHCESVALKERIQSEGFRFIALDHVCPDSSDLKYTLSILKKGGPEQKNWLVLDGYHFTPDYQKAVRDAGIHLLVIDDMNHLPHYHADILLNQNIHAPDLHYHCDDDTTLLLGTRYVLLRREFLKYREFKRQIPDRAKNILVTLGGADPDNVTLKVIEALKLLDMSEISVRIIIGPANPHQEILYKAIASVHYEVELPINPPNMPEMMAWADIAISASGSTCWEFVFMGLPALILILSENQTTIGVQLDRQGSVLNLGWHTLLESVDVACHIHEIIISPEKRGSMSNCGRQLVDGCGALRVIRRLNGCELSLRYVRAEDCRILWEWANDPVTRAQSFSTEMIPWEKHVAWLESKQNDPSMHFYIAAEKKDVPVGLIRYQIDGQAAVVSISLAPEQRGRGYGAKIIQAGTQELWATTKTNIIHAYIKQDNIASIRAFTEAGFINAGIEEIHGCPALHYILRKVRDHEYSVSN